MDIELKEFEENIERIQASNSTFLFEFTGWLEEKELKPKTIEKHVGNIRFYGNEYLANAEQETLDEDTTNILDFMGYYFPQKCLWANKTTVNEYVASFKKFYLFMTETERVPYEEYMEMNEMIKEEKEFWQSLVM